MPYSGSKKSNKDKDNNNINDHTKKDNPNSNVTVNNASNNNNNNSNNNNLYVRESKAKSRISVRSSLSALPSSKSMSQSEPTNKSNKRLTQNISNVLASLQQVSSSKSFSASSNNTLILENASSIRYPHRKPLPTPSPAELEKMGKIITQKSNPVQRSSSTSSPISTGSTPPSSYPTPHQRQHSVSPPSTYGGLGGCKSSNVSRLSQSFDSFSPPLASNPITIPGSSPSSMSSNGLMATHIGSTPKKYECHIMHSPAILNNSKTIQSTNVLDISSSSPSNKIKTNDLVGGGPVSSSLVTVSPGTSPQNSSQHHRFGTSHTILQHHSNSNSSMNRAVNPNDNGRRRSGSLGPLRNHGRDASTGSNNIDMSSANIDSSKNFDDLPDSLQNEAEWYADTR
eukprot:Awhi_evm1s13664